MASTYTRSYARKVRLPLPYGSTSRRNSRNAPLSSGRDVASSRAPTRSASAPRRTISTCSSVKHVSETKTTSAVAHGWASASAQSRRTSGVASAARHRSSAASATSCSGRRISTPVAERSESATWQAAVTLGDVSQVQWWSGAGRPRGGGGTMGPCGGRWRQVAAAAAAVAAAARDMARRVSHVCARAVFVLSLCYLWAVFQAGWQLQQLQQHSATAAADAAAVVRTAQLL